MAKIACWNVNSLPTRIGHLATWLETNQPDAICIQELKCVAEAVPTLELESLGYKYRAIVGQKTYNGVAIISKHPLKIELEALPDAPTDQARYVQALMDVHGKTYRVASVYVHNGQSVGSDKYQMKHDFYLALKKHLRAYAQDEIPTIIAGDYNVAPNAVDVHDPKSLDGSVCYHPEERNWWRSLQNLGYYDAFAMKHPNTQQFSWWDYRGGSYPMNKGLRIDQLMLNSAAADSCIDSTIHSETRGWEQPSDHCPVAVELN